MLFERRRRLNFQLPELFEKERRRAYSAGNERYGEEGKKNKNEKIRQKDEMKGNGMK